ncbi:MAG: phasin family protein, partial [Proteobacteria bacterium]|nr:phasin family protein [Pseudomonadota bacterium]
IGNDAKLIIENILEMGKKNLDKLPMKKTIEKKISSGIESIPSRLNLPSRDEIDNLVIGIDGVNKKVDELNKHFATA